MRLEYCSELFLALFSDTMSTKKKSVFYIHFVFALVLSFPAQQIHKFLQLFVYDTVNKNLSSKQGEQPKLPFPPSLVAGACAGVSSTLVTYPLELVKTRLTIQVCKSHISDTSFRSL